LNRVKFVFSDKVIEQNGRVYLSKMDQIKLIDPVLRPQLGTSHGPFQTVILDPGHGGSDPGALNSLGTEARYNLILAREVKRQLEAAGYKVILTRQTDQYLSLEERVRRANALRANAVFVSLHFNSGRSHARGIETFTLSPPGVSHYGRDLLQSDQIQRTGNRQDSANIALATAVHGSVLGALGTHTLDRGIKRARFTVLSGVRHPAILFEGGFMSHPSEARLIHREDHRKRLAAGIVQGVRRYQNAIKSRGKAGQRLP
ncbi:MAG: N-acetylmuramoyl-L-alanine amidase family protein, partial [Luteolibacter sp.]